MKSLTLWRRDRRFYGVMAELFDSGSEAVGYQLLQEEVRFSLGRMNGSRLGRDESSHIAIAESSYLLLATIRVSPVCCAARFVSCRVRDG